MAATGSTFDALGSAPAYVMSSLEMQGVVGAGVVTFAVVVANRATAFSWSDGSSGALTNEGSFGSVFVILANPSQVPVN